MPETRKGVTMVDQLSARRELVKRATEAGIPNAMKTKSAELERLLADMEGNTVTQTSAPETPETVAPDADPDAPYGRKADGTPRARPGRKPADGSTPRQTAPKPGRKAPATRARTAAPDYRPGIAGVLQVPAAALAMAGRFRPELAYDAAAIAVHTPTIADALNTLAQEEPRVAAVLDRILAIGPYGAIVGVVVTLGAQIAVNHKRLPVEAGQAFGAVDPDTLMASLAPTV